MVVVGVGVARVAWGREREGVGLVMLLCVGVLS